jgi:hypothetical protein
MRRRVCRRAPQPQPDRSVAGMLGWHAGLAFLSNELLARFGARMIGRNWARYGGGVTLPVLRPIVNMHGTASATDLPSPSGIVDDFHT